MLSYNFFFLKSNKTYLNNKPQYLSNNKRLNVVKNKGVIFDSKLTFIIHVQYNKNILLKRYCFDFSCADVLKKIKPPRRLQLEFASLIWYKDYVSQNHEPELV